MVRGDAPARSYDLKTSVSWFKMWLRESDSWNLTKIRQRQAQRSWTREPVAGRGPENTRKWSGKNIGGRIPLPMAETALKADVYGKAVPWATKREVMHDPWVVFDHG
ncbi:hypothetical protein F2Q69_00003307 [Brassica cretica]|uniref:Uncharacterized protein n=1 Tax=Brassica cretica TaxID=69181 RepID=A0A8S9PJ82_BRACR|nr:hypothetical protein F2Q69_00003307 [Brassica cretica]